MCLLDKSSLFAADRLNLLRLALYWLSEPMCLRRLHRHSHEKAASLTVRLRHMKYQRTN